MASQIGSLPFKMGELECMFLGKVKIVFDRPKCILSEIVLKCFEKPEKSTHRRSKCFEKSNKNTYNSFKVSQKIIKDTIITIYTI